MATNVTPSTPPIRPPRPDAPRRPLGGCPENAAHFPARRIRRPVRAHLRPSRTPPHALANRPTPRARPAPTHHAPACRRQSAASHRSRPPRQAPRAPAHPAGRRSPRHPARTEGPTNPSSPAPHLAAKRRIPPPRRAPSRHVPVRPMSNLPKKHPASAIAQPHPSCYDIITKITPALRPACTSAKIP